ncbi:sigma factor-binding protein Crl [Psychromonas sp. psych-6C06]|uniref:sigma factor-binding protein Crl n=1 Tax=Psychromonas sp. psych-6C06 TaxID=2058089 RepID=UPI000C348D95|nr:sigma factor-binding protein Crl [Psychromonas sp. psych-6C06]PKF62861.1 sigma factor-binding protein Crl [Psychromonas sp. psych-6C06]
MTSALPLSPSRGRLFKIFTDLGPYFRKLQSTESSFFFDCLEICVDDKKEPEEREFLGWWLIVTRTDDGYDYERFDGLYNLDGDWVTCKIKKADQKLIDASFDLFLERLKTLIETETGFCLAPLEVALA